MKKVGMSYDNDIDILDWDVVQSDDDYINSKRSCKALKRRGITQGQYRYHSIQFNATNSY